MSGAPCATCGRELPHELERCFDCELGDPPPPEPPRAIRAYQCEGDRRDAGRLAFALGALCPDRAAGDVAWVVRERSFDVVADASDGQAERLVSLLLTCVATVAPAEGSRAPSRRGLRLMAEGRVRQKLGATVAIGGGAAALGLPFLPLASVAMGAVLVARAARVVERRLRVSRAQADAHLGAVDPEALAHAREARATVDSSAALAALRPCLAATLESSFRLRASGLHLTSPEIRRADQEVTDLAHALSELAIVAQSAVKSVGAHAGESMPYRDPPRARAAALDLLPSVSRRFQALREPGADLRASSRDALAAVRSALRELRPLL